MYIIVYI